MQKNAFIPWTITLLLGAYVFGLTYHAKNRLPPPPIYDFYDTTVVKLEVANFEGDLDVMGTFNNIVEGRRQIIQARNDPEGGYSLVFKVNSPRPAMVYVDDAPLEIFLQPDSTLHISLMYDRENNKIDSVDFYGATEDICSYYLDKSRYFEGQQLRARRHILGEDNLANYSQQLDSMANDELEFISEYTAQDSLPDWFVNFEKNEIVYHKGYLKLSNAFNREVPLGYYDDLELNKSEAVFSYYYYLYLKAYITNIDKTDLSQMTPSLRGEVTTQHHMNIADTLLEGESHDVFLTRMIFQHMTPNRAEFASRLISHYRDRFNKKKYRRFLVAQLDSLKFAQ